jgi:hypothetical protein
MQPTPLAYSPVYSSRTKDYIQIKLHIFDMTVLLEISEIRIDNQERRKEHARVDDTRMGYIEMELKLNTQIRYIRYVKAHK